MITKFRSINVQGLLVYLTIQSERPFPRDVLATLFWPDVPESTARTNLRQSLYQLRKSLNAETDDTSYLLIDRQTVQFNPEADFALDVHNFIRAAKEGDWQTAAALYNGDLLPGFSCGTLTFDDWLRHEREHLHHLALDTFIKQCEQLLLAQSNAQAITIAEKLLALEPWHEQAHRFIMMGLAQSGNISGALAQFETCKRVLWEELGVEPQEETAVLAHKISEGEDISSILASQQPSHNLTSHLTPFFGRDNELALIKSQLTEANERLLSLVGEGGIGKSRLATQAGWQLLDHFNEGVWFVSLAGVSVPEDEAHLPEQIATAIAQAMHHTMSGQQAAKTQLTAFLRQRHTLLILDNFEHILAGADIVVALLEQAPQLQVLCTTREPLNFLAERIIPISPLTIPEKEALISIDGNAPSPLESFPAIQLFLDRANRSGQFKLTPENQKQVIELCHLLSGIPLALELAAAGLKRRPLAQLLVDIQQSVDSLTTRRRDLKPRHRSMRAVFDASWGLLANHEQATFALLSVFRGGFSQAAAEAVTGATLLALQNLQEKSLLYFDNGRYRLHALLRQFLAEKLNSGDLKPLQSFTNPTAFMQEQHSRYYLNFVAERGSGLNGEAAQIPADEIALELDNIRLAWETAVEQNNTTDLLSALVSLSDFFQMRGFYREGERLFGLAAARLRPVSNFSPQEGHALAQLLAQQAAMHVRLSNYPAAEALLVEAQPLAQQAANHWLECRVLITWSETHWRRGDLADAENKLALALPIALDIADQQLTGIATFHLGVVHDLKGQHEQSLALLERALDIFEVLGNGRWLSFALNSVGFVAQRLSKWEKAESALLQSIKINQQNNDLQNQISALNNLSLIATKRGEYYKANNYIRQSLSIAENYGDLERQAIMQYNLARNAQKLGDLKNAIELANKSIELYQIIADKLNEGRALRLLGDIKHENGRIPDAISFYRSALKLSQEVGDKFSENEVLQALHRLEATKNDNKAKN